MGTGWEQVLLILCIFTLAFSLRLLTADYHSLGFGSSQASLFSVLLCKGHWTEFSPQIQNVVEGRANQCDFAQVPKNILGTMIANSLYNNMVGSGEEQFPQIRGTMLFLDIQQLNKLINMRLLARNWSPFTLKKTNSIN